MEVQFSPIYNQSTRKVLARIFRGFDLEQWLPPAKLWFEAFLWSRNLFWGVYRVSKPPKDGCWEVVTASIQINFLYRNNSLVQLIKQGLLWNHILIEIIAHRTSPTSQSSCSSESKWFIDFFFLFSPSRKWSRQISDKWKDRNSKWTFFNSPFGSKCCLFVRLFSNLWTSVRPLSEKALVEKESATKSAKLSSSELATNIILVLLSLFGDTRKVYIYILSFCFVLFF